MKVFLLMVGIALVAAAGLIAALVLGYRATIRRYIQWADDEKKKQSGNR